MGYEEKNEWGNVWRWVTKVEKDVKGTEKTWCWYGVGGKLNRAHPATEQRNKPMSHTRIVIAYMLGSSILDTDALTSGKGLSSSLMALRLDSILRGRNKMGYGGVDMKERRGTNSKLGLMGIAVNGDAAPRESDPIVTHQPPHEKAREKRTLYPLHIFDKSGLDE